MLKKITIKIYKKYIYIREKIRFGKYFNVNKQVFIFPLFSHDTGNLASDLLVLLFRNFHFSFDIRFIH